MLDAFAHCGSSIFLRSATKFFLEVDLLLAQGVSWSTVRYMIGEVQYGGRVTDDYDKILLNTYAKVWFGEPMFAENFQFYIGECYTKNQMRFP